MEAQRLQMRYGLFHWDCLILAAAVQGGCDTVYSEDMNPRQTYAGIRVVNPFRDGD